MKISAVTSLLESLAPPAFQEDYDNSGLQTGDLEKECSGVLVSLDTTEAVIEEAVQKGCNLLISHHPLIFHGLKQISRETGTGKAILTAVKNDITVYAIHTNLDNVLPGVSSTIADKLGLRNRSILAPKPPGETGGLQEAGSGLIGNLERPLAEKQFLDLLREKFGVPVVRHSPLTGKAVNRVALCGGSGSFLIPNALAQGADFFVSADIRYHSFFEAEGSLVIADIGHYESEQFAVDLLCDVILKKFPNFAVLKAGTATNPVHYYL
ncbi:MAG TPA: Nif3-like dinuclear metal center hexameric protein [Puia sp.]